MKRFISRLFILSVLLFTCIACERLVFISLIGVNNTNEDIWISIKDNRYRVRDPNPEEVSWYEDGVTLNNYTEFFLPVPADSMGLVFLRNRDNWDGLFPDSLCVFVWKDQLFQGMGWDSFLHSKKDYSLSEVEYVLSVDDLSDLNYKIPYPPKGAIENKRIIWHQGQGN